MIGDILQPTHLLFLLVIVLIVLGPKRLPEVARSLGHGFRDFKDAISGSNSPLTEFKDAVSGEDYSSLSGVAQEPAPPSPPLAEPIPDVQPEQVSEPNRVPEPEPMTPPERMPDPEPMFGPVAKPTPVTEPEPFARTEPAPLPDPEPLGEPEPVASPGAKDPAEGSG